MNLIKLLKFITKHPLNRNSKISAIIRLLKWQINSILNPYPVIYPFAEKSKLIVWKGLTGATQNIYCGLHEFEDMSFLLHFLRKDDQFVDVGANIGSYTILAASETNTNTISFEPVPETFFYLQNNIKINNIDNMVKAYNMALGAKKGTLLFTKDLDTTNHVATSEDTNTIKVNVESFDNLITLNKPTLIKIDVEGFETDVINGMENALKSKYLKAIIIELNNSGKRYGYNDDNIHKKLIDNNFKAYKYEPFKRKLQKIETYNNTENTLYIKDYSFVEKRIKEAEKIKIHNNVF